MTIYAQVGWADIELDDSGFKDGIFSSLEGRVFLTEDCGFNVGAGYSSTGDARFGGNDLDAWNWKFEAFSRVSETLPIYASLGYAGAQYDLDSSGADETESHRVMLGFSVLFGAKSALENDRRGATLNTPLEPTWCGHLTLEISNTTPLPAKIYGGEGIAQLLFFGGEEEPRIAYADRQGKYQDQVGVTLPRL